MSATEQHLTPQQAAVHVMAIFEQRGARFTLDADGCMRCDLNRCTLPDSLSYDDAAQVITALRHEIRQLLAAQTGRGH